MEHDDLNIRKKIQDWENSGEVYNADKLWAGMVMYPAARPTRPSGIYLAAAAVVLSGSLVIYSLGETQRKAIELRIMEIELALQEEASIQVTQMTGIEQQAEVPCPITNETPRPVTRTRRAPVIQQASLIQEATQELVPVIEKPEPVVVPSTEIENVSATDPKPTPRVILGSHSVAGRQSTSKSSRLKLQLFKGDQDLTETSRPGTPIVTLAGINN